MQNKKKARFFDSGDTLFRYNLDTIIPALFLLAVGIFENGALAVLQAVTCVLTSCVSEYLSFKLILRREKPLSDLGAVSTGLLISLLLPPCAPLFVGAVASAFAVLVCKLPFGSTRNSPFVPCAAAICFSGLCFGEYVFTYPASQSTELVFSNSESFVSGVSLLDMLSRGTVLRLNTFNVNALLSGSFPGATGTTCLLALAAVLVYVAVRRPKRLFCSFGFLLTCALFAFAFPRTSFGRVSSVVTELCAGSLIFVALLVLNEPVTSPKKKGLAFLYGAAAGISCMLVRLFLKNADVDSACLSVMIVNAFAPIFENREKPSPKKKAEQKALSAEKEAQK